MKKALSILASLLILASFLTALPVSATDAAIVYTAKDVVTHVVEPEETLTLSCLFRNDIPDLPYIEVTDYLNHIYKVAFTSADNGNGAFTVSNKNGSFIIDAEKDIIRFDCFEEVVYRDVKEASENMKAEFIEDDNQYTINGEKKGMEFNLGNYDIDITAKDGKVYLPLTTISDLFCSTYFYAQYLGGEIHFIKGMDNTFVFDDTAYYEQTKRNENLALYTYSELCFVMDCLYGAPPKSKLAGSIREKGFDRTLEEYDAVTKQIKAFLLTDNQSDFFLGQLMLADYLDDGGHTIPAYGVSEYIEKHENAPFAVELQSRMASPENAPLLSSQLEESAAYEQTKEALKKQKAADLRQYTVVKEWKNSLYLQDGETGMFCFDEFEDVAVKNFKWSLDYAKEHGVKNFVIDLSTNGGGSSGVAAYFLAILTHQVQCTLHVKNAGSGNLLTLSPRIDVNLDGKFDEKDKEVSYDFRFAVLTTAFSFSSANLLPCMAHDNGIAVIGENSGGGTCMIAKHPYPQVSSYFVSDNLTMIHADGADLDAGVAPDVVLAKYGYAQLGALADYTGFYDMAKITKAVTDHYSGGSGSTPASAGKPSAATAETPAQNGAGNTTLWWVIGIAAAVVIIAVVCVVILKKKRKG